MFHNDVFTLLLDISTLDEFTKYEVNLEQMQNNQLCFECLQPVEKVKLCGRCLHAVYCDKACQTRAWKHSGHKISCGVVKVAKIVGAPEKGYGVVACRDISEGDIVMMEKPLLNVSISSLTRTQINETFLSMDDSSKRKLMALDSSNVDYPSKLPRIIAINNFQGKGRNILVYNMISRLNHSCIPNIRVDVQSTDTNVLFTPVVALKPIKQGQELVFNYLVESGKYSTRDERRFKLRQDYAIDNCQCPACSLNGAKLIKSDTNRRHLKEVENQIATNTDGRIQRLVEKKKKLLEDEGLDTMNNFMMLTKDLLLAAHALKNPRDVKKYQEEGLKYAKRLHDHEMIEYFSQTESERMFHMFQRMFTSS